MTSHDRSRVRTTGGIREGVKIQSETDTGDVPDGLHTQRASTPTMLDWSAELEAPNGLWITSARFADPRASWCEASGCGHLGSARHRGGRLRSDPVWRPPGGPWKTTMLKLR
jgi:hypothetical protein